ncbi:MAG TPA: hypothetical protein VJO34_00065 [Methylomirabilota bacterium]|nr:hypothetical protein [Methylomirabilota bacterium]
MKIRNTHLAITGLVPSILGALLLAGVSTLGDFIWTHFSVEHRPVYGLTHGTLLCSVLGSYLGLLRKRFLQGTLGGAAIGFALLEAGAAGIKNSLLRGTLAGVASGLAFYAISGIWLDQEPGGPNYVRNFLSWTIAFLPGFLALLAARASSRDSRISTL